MTWVATAVIGISAAVTVGTALYSGAQQAKEGKKARESAEQIAAQNRKSSKLSPDEAKQSASKRAFRQGVFFTSPTGAMGGGARGRSRLIPGA